MAQVKIYGLRRQLNDKKVVISEAIHQAVVTALDYPPEKRFHRFILLDDDSFIYPEDRSENYLIIEISLFVGRTTETKKALIRGLFEQLETAVAIAPQDVEITLFETPRENWGIRGLPGDELQLTYQVQK